MAFISVVSPVYCCKNSLYELYFRLKETLEKINSDFEIILVNDASPDGAWELIVELSNKDKRVKGINLSRNFGQHNAINAGLDHCTGEWIIIMDCDLQDQPEEIGRLYTKATEGFDIVFARRGLRNDKFFKKTVSRFFYWVFNFLTNIPTDYSIANFGIYKDIIIKEYLKIKEREKVFPIVIRHIGFKSTVIEVIHAKRISGKSSYNIAKLIKLALKIIVTQSNKPLYISIYFGFAIALLAFLYGIYLIVRYFFLDVPLGYTSIIAAILFIGGIIFCNLGLIGIYLGKVFNEVKERPDYIIHEKTFNKI
jgi:polyisoprenyl-phosphate glycosyltransferase